MDTPLFSPTDVGHAAEIKSESGLRARIAALKYAIDLVKDLDGPCHEADVLDDVLTEYKHVCRRRME